MPTIDIIIRNKTASAVNPPCIVCGNSDYNVKFNFDEEWQAHNNKIGVFAYNRCGEWQSEKVLFEGDTCPVPALHGVRSVWIGVTAGDVRTSTPADVPCRMGATDFSDAPEKPSEDIWTQILDKLDELQTEIDEIKEGGGGEVYYVELDGEYPSYTLSAGTPFADIAKAYAANKSIVCRCEIGNTVATLPLFVPMPKTNTWVFSGSGALGELYPAQTFTVMITPYGVQAEQRRIAVQTDLDAVKVKADETVLFTPQMLADEQKQQARKNIGINPEVRNTSMTNPVGVDGYGKLWSKADISLGVTATVGQTVKVKAVDADGKPTAWEAVDMSTGDAEVWEKVCEVTTTEDTTAIYQAFGGSYKKIRAIFWGESTAACQVWIYPNAETLPAGRDIAYIFNAPYAAAGKYMIVGEFSSSPYPAPNSSDNWYRGRCSIAREWKPQCLHAGWGDNLFDNYVNDFYAHLGEGDLAQGVKSLYWTHSTGEIKAGTKMVVYGVKA